MSARIVRLLALALAMATGSAAGSVPNDIQQLVLAGPPGSERFGSSVTWLPNGNFVVIDPLFDLENGTQNVGAVWVYRFDGSVVSRLTGANANDQLGNTDLANPGSRVILLPNSNFVVRSFGYNAQAGSVTFVNGTTGLNGVISPANSLVGGSPGDLIGSTGGGSGIQVLANGDYVVQSPSWDAPGGIIDAGAVTQGSGTTGITGVVSAANSLVGSRARDLVGERVTVLTNGNYVVASIVWDREVSGTILINSGALTWQNAASPTFGPVSEANSLVTDNSPGSASGLVIDVTALANGNYVVAMPGWSNVSQPAIGAGAVVWGSGTVPLIGVVSAANALIGTTAGDQVGSVITALADGNYVVGAPRHNGSRGAVRWVNGSAPVTGLMTQGNSLVGSIANDQVGGAGILGLPNGAYLVASRDWDRNGVTNVGAVTYGPAGIGVTGPVSPTNSLVGTRTADLREDATQGIVVLSNGHYVIGAPDWDLSASITDVGAAIWADGNVGVFGEISAANALIGSTAGDRVGATSLVAGRVGIVALANGHYVVSSESWDNGALTNVGAATWGDGVIGTRGPVSAANSLTGAEVNDRVGGAVALTSGHYVVRSANSTPGFGSLGAVTWVNGIGPNSALMTAANSLVGTRFDDNVGTRITALANGNYVVNSRNWSTATISRAGASTWGNGFQPMSGPLGANSATGANNSLIGARADDLLGDFIPATALPDGNYFVTSPFVAGVGFRGAISLGYAGGGLVGVINGRNSVLGGVETNGNFTARTDYDVATRTLLVGHGAQNRVILARYLADVLMATGFE
jgi:hypothetical protein